MTREQIKLIRTTWAAVARLEVQTVGAIFFERLFRIAPELEEHFFSTAPRHTLKFTDLLTDFTDALDTLTESEHEVLPFEYASCNPTRQQCLIVGNALLWTLENGLQQGWTDAVEEAWAVFVQKVCNAVTAPVRYKNAA